MKTLLLTFCVFFTSVSLNAAESYSPPVEEIVKPDPDLPKKKDGKVKRFFKKLNPFGKSSSPNLSHSQRSAIVQQQSQQSSTSEKSSSNNSIRSNYSTSSYIGVYDKFSFYSNTSSSTSISSSKSSRSGIYDKVPPIYDKVPPIYDKVPTLKASTYDKLPPPQYAAIPALKAPQPSSTFSGSKLMPMHAVMNQQAANKAKTMGQGIMTAQQRGQFIQELQKKQKQILVQKRKEKRAIRMRQAREVVNYLQNPSKAKASGSGREIKSATSGKIAPPSKGSLPPPPPKSAAPSTSIKLPPPPKAVAPGAKLVTPGKLPPPPPPITGQKAKVPPPPPGNPPVLPPPVSTTKNTGVQSGAKSTIPKTKQPVTKDVKRKKGKH